VKSLLRSFWVTRAPISGAALLVLAATAHLALTPRDALAPDAVVYAPWVAADKATGAATDAGTQILRAGAASNIAVMLPDDPGNAARASARGAWLVADAAALIGCAEPVPR
jgi:hypothetical protein